MVTGKFDLLSMCGSGRVSPPSTLSAELQTRPAAADLWRKGLADKILVSQTPDDQTEFNCRMLLNLGVPAGVIQNAETVTSPQRWCRRFVCWNSAGRDLPHFEG